MQVIVSAFLVTAVFSALLAGPAEAPAAARSVVARAPAPVEDPRRVVATRLLPAGNHWASGLALGLRR